MADKDKYSAQETIKVCTNKNRLGKLTNFPLNQTMQIILGFFFCQVYSTIIILYIQNKNIYKSLSG